MEEISSGGQGAWLHWDRGWALWGLLFTSCIPRSQSLPAFKDREKTADGGVGKQQLCPRTAQRATPPLRAAPSSSLPPKPPQRPTWQRASMQPYGRAESTASSCKSKHDPSRQRGEKPKGGWGGIPGGSRDTQTQRSPHGFTSSPRIPQNGFPLLCSEPADGHPSLQSLGDRRGKDQEMGLSWKPTNCQH